MSKARKLPYFSVWDKNAVLQAFEEGNVKAENALRMWSYMIRFPNATWKDVEPPLPKKAVEILDKHFKMYITKVVSEQKSEGGDTVKLLVEMADGLQVECVIMTYNLPPVPAMQPAEEGDVSSCAVANQEGRADDGKDSTAGEAEDDGDVFEDALEDFTADEDLLRVLALAEVDDSPTDASVSASSVPRRHPATSGIRRKCEADGRPAAPLPRQRSTVCVSSQVGCQMGCTFCATGTMGLRGNLTCGEIVEQLLHARAVADIQNVVFMGMGEPLMNYDAVVAAVGMMTHSRLLHLKRRKVTVSTVGVVPRLRQLARDLPGVSLALSLHAPRQDLRVSIVPSAKAYKMEALMGAVKEYMQTSGQKVFIEYVMLAGVNDTPREAKELGELLRGLDVVVNLIPWNPVVAAASAKEAAAAAERAFGSDAPSSSSSSSSAAEKQSEKQSEKAGSTSAASGGVMLFEAPAAGAVESFSNTLQSEFGLHTTVRQEMGQDIAGACGQLVVAKLEEQSAAAAASAAAKGVSDIEDLASSRCGKKAPGAAGCA